MSSQARTNSLRADERLRLSLHCFPLFALGRCLALVFACGLLLFGILTGESAADPLDDVARSGSDAGLMLQGGEEVAAWGELLLPVELGSATPVLGAALLSVAIANDLVSEGVAAETDSLSALLTLVFLQDLADAASERLLAPLGLGAIAKDSWREAQEEGGPAPLGTLPVRDFAGGLQLSLETTARLAELHLANGDWQELNRFASGFREGRIWQDNTAQDLAGIPRDAYWLGLGDSSEVFVGIVPSLALVVVAQLSPDEFGTRAAEAGRTLETFFESAVRTVSEMPAGDSDASERHGSGGGETDASVELAASAPPSLFSATSAESGPGALAASSGSGLLGFDGVDDQLVIPDHESLDPGAAFSIEAWVRPDSIASSSLQDRILSRRFVYELMISTSSSRCDFGSAGHLQWRLTVSGANRLLCGGSLVTGAWHHVAGTFDGAVARLYIDGALVASTPRSGSIKASGENLEIGSQPGSTRFFEGAIDEVRMWNTARSDAQLQASRPGDLAGDEAGLILLLDLDEGAGQTALDRSPYANHATLGSDSGVESSDPTWTGGGEGGGTLEELFVSPMSVQLPAGSSVQFAASGVDSTGAPVAVAPAWSATGGSIDADGRYVAGSVAGGFAVTASEAGLVAQAGVTVIDVPTTGAPYPQSSRFAGIVWADEATIVREAPGSDNWPLTWADDDLQYTTYGDGWGFAPGNPVKLSLGLAKVPGPPSAPSGMNISSPTGEQPENDGRSGKKASGILMVDGVLYMWVRNADEAGHECEVASSTDRAETWSWAGWRFAELGFCVFLNFGKNYAGARDAYVYMYSPDTPDAYRETDDVVLTRVPKAEIEDRAAYEFFSGTNAQGEPTWSSEIADRAPVFSFAEGSNRLSVNYNAAQQRYLMTMRSAARAGGVDHFSIYDAPEPWGPWTTVYYTESWEGTDPDVDQWGESQQIPTKWIAPDGESFHLVFAGEDSFSVREATLLLAPSGPDLTPPAVAITAPAEGADVAGIVGVAASASDAGGIAAVDFEIDGSALGTLLSAPWTLSWDTRSVSDGPHTVGVIATDDAGNVATALVDVEVDNSGAGSAYYLEFDGEDDQLIVPSDPLLDFSDEITIEAWIRPDTLSTSTRQDRVVSKRLVYELTVSTGDTGCHFGSDGHVQFRLNLSGANRRLCGGVLAPGQWHHLAATYDGAAARIYVDGAEVASTPRSGTIRASSDALEIGSQPTQTRFFDGGIDEVRLWSRARSAAEIANDAASPPPGNAGNQAGLVAHWPFDEGSGQLGADATGNGNDAVLGNTSVAEPADPLWSPGAP